MNVIESENNWRVSHSGYSIKCGWPDNVRIVCQYPGSSAPGKLDWARFEQWLKDAEHICELHNAALTPPPVVEVTDETAYELHQALHNARSEYIRKTPDPLPWYWDMAAWIYAVQQVLGQTLGRVTREELARAVEAAFKEGIMKQREAYIMGKTHHEVWLNSNARTALGS